MIAGRDPALRAYDAPRPDLVLPAVRRALARESAVLVQRPDWIRQQLHNRLQWGPEELEPLLAEARRQLSEGLWWRTVLPFPEPGALLRRLEGHGQPVEACAIAPDGRTLATVGLDDTVRTWDIASGAERSRAPVRGQAAKCSFGAGGSVLAVTDGPAIQLRDPVADQPVGSLSGHVGFVRGLAFAPSGRVLASVGQDDGTVKFWDVVTMSLLRQWSAGCAQMACAFTPDGRRLVTASVSDAVVLEVESAQPLITLQGHEDTVLDCAVSPDGSLVATAGVDRTVRLWELASGSPVGVLAGHVGWVTSCAFAPDGRTLLSTSEDGTVRIWDVGNGAQVASLTGARGGVSACTVTPDGRRIVTVGNGISVWDTAAATESSPEGDQVLGVPLSFTADGIRLVTHGDRLRVHRVVDGVALAQRDGVACAVSPDGDRVACTRDVEAVLEPAGAQLRPGATVEVWDVATDRVLGAVRRVNGGAAGCAFSPDGALLALADGPELLVLVAETGKVVRRLAGHREFVTAVAFDPLGSVVAGGAYDGAVVLWEVSTGRRLRNLTAAGWIVHCRFSPDGTRLLTRTERGDGELWDTSSGRMVARLEGAGRHLDFMPDGAVLVSVSVPFQALRGELRSWDAATGSARGSVAGVGAGWVAGPDGRWLVTGSDTVEARSPADGTVLADIPLGAEHLVIHPWLPRVAIGAGDRTVLADLVGAPVSVAVTASEDGQALGVRCPACRQRHPVREDVLGGTVDCPTPGCGTRLVVGAVSLRSRAAPSRPGSWFRR